MRVVLAVAAVALVMIGAAGIAAGAVVGTAISSQGAIPTEGQTIEATGCSTLLVEVATARIDAGRWDDVPLVESRAVLTLTPSGSTAGPWLVGAADGPDVEDRLLGSRYCLAERMASGWNVSSIDVGGGDPDVRMDGVRGLWARVGDGEGVELPIPVAATTLVVTGDDASRLESVELVGAVKLENGKHIARLALLGGIGTFCVGLGLLALSVVGSRRNKLHDRRESNAIATRVGDGS